MFTHDAAKKWYFANSEYPLLDGGLHLVLAHKRNNLTNVYSMNLYARLPAQSPPKDEYIVGVTRCEVSHRSRQICSTSVECGRALLGSCGIASHSQSIPLRVLTAVYVMSRSRIRN